MTENFSDFAKQLISIFTLLLYLYIRGNGVMDFGLIWVISAHVIRKNCEKSHHTIAAPVRLPAWYTSVFWSKATPKQKLTSYEYSFICFRFSSATTAMGSSPTSDSTRQYNRPTNARYERFYCIMYRISM